MLLSDGENSEVPPVSQREFEMLIRMFEQSQKHIDESIDEIKDTFKKQQAEQRIIFEELVKRIAPVEVDYNKRKQEEDDRKAEKKQVKMMFFGTMIGTASTVILVFLGIR